MTDSTDARDLTAWISAAAAELAVNGEFDKTELLETARDVAHKVNRPATPLTTYMIGLAVGAGMEFGEANRLIRHLAERTAAEPQ